MALLSAHVGIENELATIRQQLAMLGTGTSDVPDSVLLDFVASVQASLRILWQRKDHTLNDLVPAGKS
jgi:hypothetical protein